jgi:hypothetical protein
MEQHAVPTPRDTAGTRSIDTEHSWWYKTDILTGNRVIPSVYGINSGILAMGLRMTSHWTAAAFTGLLSVPGWEQVNEWMNEWTNEFFNFRKLEPTVERYGQGKTEELGEKPVPADWPGRETGASRWEAGAQPPEPWHAFIRHKTNTRWSIIYREGNKLIISRPHYSKEKHWSKGVFPKCLNCND